MLFFYHIYSMAEEVREKRQYIAVVNDVDGFRRLMQRTGGILVGETAGATSRGTP